MEFIKEYLIPPLIPVILAGIGVIYLAFIGLYNGTKVVIKRQIIEIHARYMEKGYFPAYALEGVHDLYKQYKRLHGNGGIAQLIEDLEALPRQKPRKD